MAKTGMRVSNLPVKPYTKVAASATFSRLQTMVAAGQTCEKCGQGKPSRSLLNL